MNSPLSPELRKLLERTIRDARRDAEAGALKALEALAVPHGKPHPAMSPADRALRNRLRAHGKQLGDVRSRDDSQEVARLSHEVAYEHWHRMLFARFLAENHLLIEPTSGVAITMDECEELARERGEDPWVVASRFAQRMLPRIFHPEDPVLKIGLAPESRQALERHMATLPAAVFTSDDALGWTYQYWQAERRASVNAGGAKIGPDELPAVTQLFTEHYMVLFLLHNTIGAWRAGRILAERPELAENAQSEEELREAVQIREHQGYDFMYLRFVRGPGYGDTEGNTTGPWRPAAGVFDHWPRRAAELRVLDPCCGSGHFLVESLAVLVRLRMEEENLSLESGIRSVLMENIFGLELDARCAQIAAFNVAFTAWKLTRRPIELPSLQIACSGLEVGAAKNEWLVLAGDDERLHHGMERLYDLFEKAPELGSLINPRDLTRDPSTFDLYVADFADLRPLLQAALVRSQSSEEQAERAVAAQGMAHAAQILAGEYTLIATNVPYLGRREQSQSLKTFADGRHGEARQNLATIFLARAVRWIGSTGSMAAVTPQNWLFLTSYMKLRQKILINNTLNAVAILGSNAFREMNWWAATTSLVVFSAPQPSRSTRFAGFNVSADKDIGNKAAFLATSAETDILAHDGFSVSSMTGPLLLLQHVQRANPDERIIIGPASEGDLLSTLATAHHGLTTGDSERMQLRFWELPAIYGGWKPCSGSVERTQLFGGLHYVLRWENGAGAINELPGARKDGQAAWGRRGVLVRPMRHLPATLYLGDAFDINTAVIVPHAEEDLDAVWCFVSSREFHIAIRNVDQKLNVTSATLAKVPYDRRRWTATAGVEYPEGLPEPSSAEATQWLFHGHPAMSESATVLQVATTRLLGYRWPPELDHEMRLAEESRAWVRRCDDLLPLADQDGIVCLTSLRGERSAADRLRQMLQAAFGADWSPAKERELLAAAAGNEVPATSLEEWLRDRFFEEHCRLFHHRPFIWHVWDGRKDGFHAFVNCHRLAGPEGESRRTLEALTYSYLGDWIERQKAEQHEGREGADGRLAAAQDLQVQLERILTGEPPYDLFVRWKPLHRQPIGWDPDINDGVRLNIRPFLSVELRKGGRKGAGVLRWKPNIKWEKDRGKEPESLRPKEEFPWFWTCPGGGSVAERTDFDGGVAFDGNRWNDLHYTNAVKRAARDRAGGDVNRAGTSADS